MEKINLVELLKDCPEGMELDCTMYEDVCFYEITDDPVFPIRIKRIDGAVITLTKYGGYADSPSAKCVIFPKGKTTWEGFVPPCQFKDGDIAVNDKGDIHLLRTKDSSYCAYRVLWRGLAQFDKTITTSVRVERLATEEEKAKLFQAIKDNGYRWNPETKTLIRPVFPKFHKSDWVIDKQELVHQIENVVENVTNHTFGYDIVGGGYFNDNSDVRLWTIKDAKDGDMLAAHKCLVLFKKLDGLNIKCYCTYHFMNNQMFFVDTLQNKDAFHPATEEEKKKLFDAIKENGYKWNEETKILERFSVPKFKDGDILYCNANDDGEDKDMFKYIFIFDKIVDVDGTQFYYSHCHLFGSEFYDTKANLVNDYSVRFATEEEKGKLFQAIKDNGYRWNEETKTLEKLVEPEFKDGDIVTLEDKGLLVACIYKERKNAASFNHHIALYEGGLGILVNGEIVLTVGKLRFATEEEKKKLFQAIKDNGYKWNTETNTLEMLPRFKVGDTIKNKTDKWLAGRTIKSYTEGIGYFTTINDWVRIEEQDDWELIPNKFDINTLKPFDQVLVRDFDNTPWEIEFFSRLLDGKHFKCFELSYVQCIPYEGNEHLLGKKDDCNEFFRTWEKIGD